MKARMIGRQVLLPLVLAGFWLAAADSSAANGPKVTLKVKPKTERNDEQKEDIRQGANGNDVTTTTDTELETCTLTVELKMQGEPQADCQLEWYFVSENVKNSKDKGTLKIFDPGKKKISLDENAVLKETIASKPFVMTRISKDSANADDQVSGDEYKGYIVLVTQNGEILAQDSNSARFLKEEWIEQCKKAQ